MWFLIIFSLSAKDIHSIKFYTERACKEAASSLEVEAKSKKIDVSTVCVKGEI